MATPDAGGGGSQPRRRSRLPRWTRREILILIRGKWEADCRGSRRSLSGGGSPEPKWEAIASFCRRRGVERAAAQCQKRWSNLVGDFKRIKEWEAHRNGEETFWGMRSDRKKERKLPGHFDRTVYDVLNGKRELKEGDEEFEEDVVFDSGRRGESGLFSDSEEEEEDVEVEAVDAKPISERRGDSVPIIPSFLGGDNHQPPTDQPEMRTAASGCHKKQRMSVEEDGSSNLQNHLIKIFEKNNQMLAAHLEAHNVDWQLDRELRRDQTNSVIQVLHKLADSLGKIADKL